MLSVFRLGISTFYWNSLFCKKRDHFLFIFVLVTVVCVELFVMFCAVLSFSPQFLTVSIPVPSILTPTEAS